MRTIEDMRTFTFPVIIEKDEDGFFAECPALDGCFTQGETQEEVMANIKEAIELCLEDMQMHNEELPTPEVTDDLLTVQVTI